MIRNLCMLCRYPNLRIAYTYDKTHFSHLNEKNFQFGILRVTFVYRSLPYRKCYSTC